MGLDMYLYREVYLGWNYEHKREKDVYKNAVVNIPGVDKEKISAISELAMYWRKANAIHGWFVDNCGEGRDDCQRMWVPEEKLTELLETIREVLKYRNDKMAKDKLSPRAGFFFGSEDIDEYYWQDLEETEAKLTSLLKQQEIDQKNGIYTSFYYQASW